MSKNNRRVMPTTWSMALAILIAAEAGMIKTAWAGVPGTFELKPTQLAADTGALPGPLLAQAGEPADSSVQKTESVQELELTCPLSFSLSYALYSDYIFRGVNFSEYAGEGREKPNHQLTVSLGYDLGDFGAIGFDTWFEWFAGQKKIDPERGGQNLQEVDYTVYWSYPIEPIATDLTLGYTFFQFPNLAHSLRQDGAAGNNNDDRTHEYWFSLEHNDAWMWKWLLGDSIEDGVLNPSFFFAHDVGAIPGVWMEFGLSHDFEIPGIENLTITPSWTLMVDGDYWSDGFKLAGDRWSLAVEYDLTPVLQLPSWAGRLTIGGDLSFFNAFGNMEDTHTIQDEFYGGMAVTWSSGG